MDLKKIDQASSIVDWLAAYHHYHVVGHEHIPAEGPCLLAVNHSLATYDILLLNNHIYKKTGRIPRGLMDRWFFKLKWMSDLMDSMGAVEGRPEKARELLDNNEIVCVAPGGMRESIRPSTERYQVIWDQRKGFAKLALETQAPVILAACPKADDIFDIYPNKLSLQIYKKFKLPFAIIRGIGPTPLPRPIELVHFLSEPIQPPPPANTEEGRKKQLDKFHTLLIDRMHTLIGEAIAYRPEDFTL
jgi:1-acyl-sn-glycerol-3-phosphate acyltransferase